MRHRAVWIAAAVVTVPLMMWAMSMKPLDIREKARSTLAAPPPVPKCSRICPPTQFAIRVRSGAANVVGPKICFNGKTIMSHVMNNVGPGLNLAVINGENGDVDKLGYLNMNAGVAADIVAYLRQIKPGKMVVVASYDDVTAKMTDEMREIFVGMGSSLITSVKYRDNWVFVGRAGTGNQSSFEKVAVNDAHTNIYDGWPAAVEVGGCFPRG